MVHRYVFSASLPPFLAATGALAIDLLEKDEAGDIASKREMLSRNIKAVRTEMEKHRDIITVRGYEKSYIVLLELGGGGGSGPTREWDEEFQILTRIHQRYGRARLMAKQQTLAFAYSSHTHILIFLKLPR